MLLASNLVYFVYIYIWRQDGKEVSFQVRHLLNDVISLERVSIGKLPPQTLIWEN